VFLVRRLCAPLLAVYELYDHLLELLTRPAPGAISARWVLGMKGP
jgi:hypothetical protein